MTQMTRVKKSILTGMCIALCTVLPFAFHSIPNGGNIFSPMHIPALLCGLLCGAPWGFFCGLIGPLISSMITGMPGMAFLPSMMLELALYGLLSGLFMGFVRTGHLTADLYISMLPAMLIGRVIAGLARAFIFAPGTYTVAMWISGYFVTSFPAIITQLIFIPAICIALEKAHLVEKRYS